MYAIVNPPIRISLLFHIHVQHRGAASQAGIKPIYGCEVYLAARRMDQRDGQKDRRAYHLVLLAENQTGYQNLLKIASAAQLEGFYYSPRIDHKFIASHTGVPFALEGRGIASRLARAALEYARAHELKVVPLCSFVAGYIQKHPEYKDLLES